jgi:flagellar biosynthetic protein FlhB
MADGASGGDKTEKASAQKLKKAREQGQVVRSRDLATAVGIFVSLKVFVFLLPGYLESFRELFHLVYVPLGAAGSMENAMSIVWGGAAMLLVKMVLPLLCVPFAIMAASLVPGGWVLSGSSPPASTGPRSASRSPRPACWARCWSTWCVRVHRRGSTCSACRCTTA